MKKIVISIYGAFGALSTLFAGAAFIDKGASTIQLGFDPFKFIAGVGGLAISICCIHMLLSRRKEKYTVEIEKTNYHWLTSQRLGVLTTTCITRMVVDDNRDFDSWSEWKDLTPQEKAIARCLCENLEIVKHDGRDFSC